MAVELATEVLFRDSNQVVKCMARNRPLKAHKSTDFLSVPMSSRLDSPRPKTTGVIRTTVHISR